MASLRVTWSPNPPADQVVSYDVNVFLNAGLLQTVNVTGNSFELPNPSPGNYAFNVRANNIAGSSPFSAQVPGPSVPTTPTNVTVTTV